MMRARSQSWGARWREGQARYKSRGHANRLFTFTFTFGHHLQAKALVGEYLTECYDEMNVTGARL